MESIDVHDLPEEQAQLLAAFVEFLRQHQHHGVVEGHGTQATGRKADTAPARPFATWPLGVKGTLTRAEIYEHL